MIWRQYGKIFRNSKEVIRNTKKNKTTRNTKKNKRNLWKELEKKEKELVTWTSKAKEFDKSTFAIPSHSLMFTLLAMFSGKPEKIPRKILEKTYQERTSEEQIKAEKFLNSILETKTETNTYLGIKKERKIASLIPSGNATLGSKTFVAINDNAAATARSRIQSMPIAKPSQPSE